MKFLKKAGKFVGPTEQNGKWRRRAVSKLPAQVGKGDGCRATRVALVPPSLSQHSFRSRSDHVKLYRVYLSIKFIASFLS